jgi:cysteine desulfurase
MEPAPPTAYLDYAASTPVRPEALAAMLPFFTETFGNPSGGHAVARAAKSALESARESVATDLGAEPGEVVFTAGGTEADNLAVEGAARSARERGLGDGVVVAAFEHKAVLAAADRLGREGFRIDVAPVTAGGIVDLEALATLVDEHTVVVSVMLVNNEVGTIQPLADVVRIVRARSPHAVVHTDAVQAASWVDVAVLAAEVDLISVSAHKLGGPKGVGALILRDGVAVEPLIKGGAQEGRKRAGAENLAGIIGFGVAAEIARAELEKMVSLATLRDRLEASARERVPDVVIMSERVARLPNTSLIAARGVKAETLVIGLDLAGFAVSAGSACSSGKVEPSHVLAAMGVAPELAEGAIRVSLGFGTKNTDIQAFLEVWSKLVGRMRQRPEAA